MKLKPKHTLLFPFFAILPAPLFAGTAGAMDDEIAILGLAFLLGVTFFILVSLENLRTRWIPAIHARLHPQIDLLEEKNLMIESGGLIEDDNLTPDRGTGAGPRESE